MQSDTLIYQDSLLPSQTYTYQVTPKGTGSNRQPIISNEVTAVTMDTTSHDFTWEVFEFGEHGNSVLRDVAIIDENNIWAVGAIYLKDSTGANDSKLYNAVHWDGSRWNVQRITTDFHGNPITLSLEGIWGFSANDTWIVGSLPIYGDGETWEVIDVREITNSDLSLSKAWGTDSNNMYFVGRGGSIAHYNGTSWRKIESPTGAGGTEVDLRDVWGQGNIVWVSGYEETGETVLIKIVNKTAEIVFSEIVINNASQFNGTIRSLWTNTEKHLYILSSTNLYRYSNGLDNKIKPITEFGERRAWYERIRGNDVNDIFIAGYKSSVQHYNGNTWQEYTELQDEFKITFGLDYKDNIVVVVGEDYRSGFFSKGFIIIGK